MKTNIRFWPFLAQFVSELVMFQARVVEKIKAHILLAIIFFFENHAVLEVMWKYIVEWGAGERGVQGSGGETWGKETIGETQTQMGG